MKKYSAEILEGTVEDVVYRNENNDYTVLEVVDREANLVVAVGIIPMASPGEEITLSGHWTYHKEFGKQFAFDSFEKHLPREVDGILQYLSSRTVKGIGPVTALKIVNRFGTESFDVIENHPEWLADIPGITMKKAAAICESFKEQTDIRGIMMFCKDFMETGEITRVYKQLGAGAVGIITENPYVLADSELGLPFDKVDALAASLGHSPTSKNRIVSGTEHVFWQSACISGHTALPFDMTVKAVSDLLSLDVRFVEGELDRMIREGIFAEYKSGDVRYVMTREVSEAENYIAKRLYRMASEVERFSAENIEALIEKVEYSLDISFAPMQREALFTSLECGVMILTGGPGTGKTTVVKALLSIFASMGKKVVLAAPTGRAAKRMSEATGKEAKTVHRMLEMERAGDGKMRFAKGEKNPLTESVVIVDEASMLDLALTEALLSAMKRGSRLILIGDSDQLPSVGAGNILYDLIASERIRTIKLTEIFRQSKESLIITNAHKINSGNMPTLNVTDNDFFFVARESDAAIPEAIAALITERLPRAYGKDVRESIQVITPSKKGQGGAVSLNAVLQASINPPARFKREKSSHGTLFREGDRVMQITNNYDIEWERRGAVGVGLFNGDIGIVQKIDTAAEKVTVAYDDRLADYSFDMLEELELAYAITVHKSQGSEYPIIIFPAYSCPTPLMTRNLLYTAVTRARRMVIIVGRPDIVRRMVENNRVSSRYTTLKERICDYF